VTSGPTGGANTWNAFQVNMFNAYRSTYGGDLWTWANPNPGGGAPPGPSTLPRARLGNGDGFGMTYRHASNGAHFHLPKR
jgi:hypothetical protein